MRVAFIVDNQLGHRALLGNLQSALALQSTVDPIWLPLEPSGDTFLERMPRLRDKHALTFGLKARKLLHQAASEGSVQACFMHTQRMAHLAVDRMRQLPTFLSIDATPIEFDILNRGLMGSPSQKSRLYSHFRNAIHRRTYAASRGIITMSKVVATSLISAYGVNPSDVLVLWPGVDIEKWAPSADRFVDGDCRILFVGADFERKGGDFLVRWAQETVSTGFRVDIVTEHAFDPPPRVTVHTRFAPNEPGLVELVRQADLLVLPTRFDLSPWVISEAKSAGTAVISTRVGAIPELVRDGIDGWLVNPQNYIAFAQKLEEVVANRKLLYDFGVRAREDAVDRFNSVTNARMLVEFMRSKV